ncbi:MAG TPA: hypothetical protein VGR28_08925 [Candidatus Thermoplasmatota archaeon]|jgi:hypothetical protein|nr:hypothetical protein [Candidatus Thermoplasmatota archaeon]
MRAAAGLALALALVAAGCTAPAAPPANAPAPAKPPAAPAGNATAGEPAPHAASNATALQNLTWYLDAQAHMGPAVPGEARLALTGGSDPSHARDLLSFTADAVVVPQRVLNFTVHLIFDSAQAWRQPAGGIETWFGYDGLAFPIQAVADPLPEQAPNAAFDVRINATLMAGGVLLPAGATPTFLVALPGTQNPAAPLFLHIGGTNASHIHPRSVHWSMPRLTTQQLAELSGALTPDAGPGPSASEPIAVELPPGALGFVATVTPGSSGPFDFDVEVRDGSGRFVAESNGPSGSDQLALHAFNLDALPAGLTVRAVNAGLAPGPFRLVVEALLPA